MAASTGFPPVTRNPGTATERAGLPHGPQDQAGDVVSHHGPNAGGCARARTFDGMLADWLVVRIADQARAIYKVAIDAATRRVDETATIALQRRTERRHLTALSACEVVERTHRPDCNLWSRRCSRGSPLVKRPCGHGPISIPILHPARRARAEPDRLLHGLPIGHD